LSAEQAMGEGWLGALHPDDRERVFLEWNQSVRENRTMNLEHRIVRPDGRVLWVLVQSTGLRTFSGEITGYIGTITDITEYKQREKLDAELQAEKARVSIMEKEKRHLREKEMLVKDLHDGIGGIVTNIAMLGQYGLLQKEAESCHDILVKIVGLASDGSTEIRSFMNSIESGDSAWSDLLAEIKGYSEKMFEPHSIDLQVSTNFADGIAPVGPFCYVNIIRICREIIANIIKHAHASSVRLVFVTTAERFELSFTDDGRGYDQESVKRRGLANMITRAHDIGAVLAVSSSIEGTTVSLRMPLQELQESPCI
jgi:signal transduction histidine kinase